MAIGAGGPPGAWQNTATPTPLATSTWTSPNGIPYGGEGGAQRRAAVRERAFPLGAACSNAFVGKLQRVPVAEGERERLAYEAYARAL